MALMKGVYVDTEGKEHIVDLKLNADGKLEISGLQVDTLEMGSLQIASGSDASELQITDGAAKALQRDLEKDVDDVTAYKTPITWSPSSIVTLATPGTKVQLSSASVPCDVVVIQAKELNVNAVEIGGSDVLGGSTGIANRKGLITLYPTQSVTISVANLNLLYMDGLTANDSITVTSGTRS